MIHKKPRIIVIFRDFLRKSLLDIKSDASFHSANEKSALRMRKVPPIYIFRVDGIWRVASSKAQMRKMKKHLTEIPKGQGNPGEIIEVYPPLLIPTDSDTDLSDVEIVTEKPQPKSPKGKAGKIRKNPKNKSQRGLLIGSEEQCTSYKNF